MVELQPRHFERGALLACLGYRAQWAWRSCIWWAKDCSAALLLLSRLIHTIVIQWKGDRLQHAWHSELL